MASSTLDPENTPEPDRQLGKGHGTDALGPSDTSDSGSDVQSGRRLTQEADIGLDRGTNEDSDNARRQRSAGPDIGDANLDSDTDSTGTGERATAGRDTDVEMGADIDIDRIDEGSMTTDLELDDTGRPAPPAEGRQRSQVRKP